MTQAVSGIGRSDLAADLDAAAVGQPDVENGHVRLRSRNAGEGLGDRPRLAHHLNVLVRFEQGAQPRADDLVVVDEEHAQWHGRHLRIPARGLLQAGGNAASRLDKLTPVRPLRGARAPGTRTVAEPEPQMEGAEQ